MNQKLILDGKVIGVLQGNIVGYFNSATPDSPFSNFYQPKKSIKLYYDSKTLGYLPRKNVQAIPFTCVEQVFAYGKAVTMGDKKTALKILHTKANRPSTFKYLGRSVQHFNANKWREKAGIWMKLGMLAKFSQDDFSKRALEKTQNYQLGECNPYDSKWGLGTSINSDFSQAIGQNKQGKLLNNVAQELQKQGIIKKLVKPNENKNLIGDLTMLDSNKPGIIVQQVNCQNKMSTGLTPDLIRKWPQISQNYHRFCQNKKPQELLGKINATKLGKNFYVFNSFSQLDYGHKNQFTNEKLLINHLNKIDDYAKYHNLPVYVPDYIGSGLANGNWSKIKGAIDKMSNVHLVKYQENTVPHTKSNIPKEIGQNKKSKSPEIEM